MALTDMVDFPTEATDALSEATGVLTDSLLTEVTGSLHTVATDASMEDMVATDVVTTERGRLRPLLRLMLTTATVTDAATEAMDVLTVFLLMVVMAALTEDMEATDVATMERGRLRLPLRLRLHTDTATDAATEAMEATAAPMEAMVATGPTAATDALTVMGMESRQQPEHPTPHEQPRIAQYELNKIRVLDLLYLVPLRVI